MNFRSIAWIRRPFEALPVVFSAWVKSVKLFCQVRVRAMRLSLRGNLRASLADYLSRLKAEPQAGFSVLWIETMVIGIILLIVVLQFLLQQGLPEIISASANTTALEAAGADASTVSWVSFIGKAIVIFLLIGALVIGIRVASGSGSGGGGGRRTRRSRKSR